MYLAKTPLFIQKLLPYYTWRAPKESPVVYLTFDDGPIPDVTPWVLDQLRAYHAKGTFFCVGDNVRKHPAIYEAILAEGHRTGNHTMNHLNGWKHTPVVYNDNVRACGQYVKSNLFRPPYGRIRPAQRRFLQQHYLVVMWDVLSGDFDTALSPQACLQNVLDHATNGSIVVFHDSLKAEPRLKVALPGVLRHFSEKGFAFGVL